MLNKRACANTLSLPDAPRPHVERAWKTHMVCPKFDDISPPDGVEMTNEELTAFRVGVQEGYFFTLGRVVEAFQAMQEGEGQ